MNFVARLARLFRTIRYLRASQIVGRLRFVLVRPRVDVSEPPDRRSIQGVWRYPAEHRPSLVGPTRFRFLNQEADLNRIGWDDPATDLLWRYNLHYFDDLSGDDADARSRWHRNLILRWVEENPPGEGTGWHSYPVSLRIVNWIKWTLSYGVMPAKAKNSLAVQARWLTERIEWHLLGNHLFANAKGLVFAGAFFDGPEAERWLTTGVAILDRELDEQFLSDGAQFELSPMYHALGLEDLLDILNLDKVFPGILSEKLCSRLRARARSAINWLLTMSHPDGGIAFFNDAAFGVAPANERLLAYALRLGIEPRANTGQVTHLVESGYVRATNEDAVLLMDFARIGPDYQPGHGHADTLSFEFSLFGQRVFVNSGTSQYGVDKERLRQRGTAAHNTVILEGKNSSEVWSGFRVGRRARPWGPTISHATGKIEVTGRHDGYRCLRQRIEHERRFILTPMELSVLDDIGNTGVNGEAIFHLHPAVSVDAVTENSLELHLPTGERLRGTLTGGPPRIVHSTWHCEFGRSERSKKIILPLRRGTASFTVSWG